MKDMHVFERDVNGRRYRIAAQSVWDPVRGRSVARQIVSGLAYRRVARPVADEQLEQAQIASAKAAGARFELAADVLAFDTTNFDTPIATVTPGELARRGHAKSKRSDLRVVGLGVLVSETGHVPLLYRTYSGNSSDQAVLTACLDGLRALHQSLDDGECRERAQRTLVRDGNQWADGSIRLHTFATVLGLMLVSLVKTALRTGESALATMADLSPRSAPHWCVRRRAGRGVARR